MKILRKQIGQPKKIKAKKGKSGEKPQKKEQPRITKKNIEQLRMNKKNHNNLRKRKLNNNMQQQKNGTKTGQKTNLLLTAYQFDKTCSLNRN